MQNQGGKFGMRREYVANLAQFLLVNKIIVISNLAKWEDILSEIDGIDVLIISSTLYSNSTAGTFDSAIGPYPKVVAAEWNQPVLLVGSGSYGKRVGRLDLQFDDFGVITAFQGKAVQLDDTIPADPTMQVSIHEILDTFRASIITIVISD
jgi:5'-nucleotidase/UDP-sugar diphosphatase